MIPSVGFVSSIRGKARSGVSKEKSYRCTASATNAKNLSLGDEATGTVRRASAKRLERRTAAEVRLLEEALVVKGFGIRAEHTFLEMELTVRHQDLPVCTEGLVANYDWGFDIACG